MFHRRGSSNSLLLWLTVIVKVIFLTLESCVWQVNAAIDYGDMHVFAKHNPAPLVPLRAPQSSYPVPLPQDEPTDPSDDEISGPLYFHGEEDKLIYKKNPCGGYHEYGKYNSAKNKRRRRRCGKARDKLKGYLATQVHGRIARVGRCHSVKDSRCLEFVGKVSRCYVKVDVDEGRGSFVLINNC